MLKIFPRYNVSFLQLENYNTANMYLIMPLLYTISHSIGRQFNSSPLSISLYILLTPNHTTSISF